MRKNEDYTKYYKIIRPIKDEGISIIYEAENIKTKEIKALKVYDMGDLSSYITDIEGRIPNEDDIKRYIDGFKNQIKFMEILQGQNRENQNSVIFNEYFETRNEFVIVMELCDCNLYNHILNKTRQNGLDSEEIYDILSQLNDSFEIMFQNKILHRNLRIENILIKYEVQERYPFLAKLKFTDDCCSSEDHSNNLSSVRINNNYRIYAPEVLEKGKYTEESDLWSLGILIYLLYFNNYPFIGASKEEVLKQISRLKNEEIKRINNEELDDLVVKLLVIDPKKRLTWEEYFNHPFFINNPKNNYAKFYEKGNKIGKGSFGTVYEAIKRSTGEKMALKIIDKIYLKKFEYENTKVSSIIQDYKREIKFMKIVEGKNKDNENALKFYEYFNMKDEFVIVIELCEQNLLEYSTKKKATFNSKEICDLLCQLNNTFRIMAENKIVHRDLKLDNILVKTENNRIIYKLIDYGVSKQLPRITNIMSTKVGAILFTAPEILEGNKFKANCDLWSLGIIIYYLYFKEYPYKEMTEYALLNQIKKLGKKPLKKVKDSNLNDLICKLLVANPEQRMSWEDYFKHPFFKN